MPNPEFFKAAGFMLKEGFLTSEECVAIREEMLGSQQSDATLLRKGSDEFVVDPNVRKTRLAKVSKATRQKIQDGLINMLPALSGQYGQTLTEILQTDFLMYREGDFIAAHEDVSKSKDRVESNRKVSIVVFLNDQSEASSEGTYAGGALVFYKLLPPPFDILGHPLIVKRGTLVAFRPSILHEVRPVTRGIRFTIVSWCG